MNVSPYLSFNGQCEDAFRFYEHCFRGKLGPLFRYEGSPAATQVPPEWGDKIMHGSITIGDLLLMGADVAPSAYETPKGFSMSLQLTDTDEAERIFAALSDGGEVSMALEKTFWAERFGIVIDRFGVKWSINCGEFDAA
jgi:PhnB protein